MSLPVFSAAWKINILLVKKESGIYVGVFLVYACGSNLVLALEGYIAVAKPLKYLSFMMSGRVIQMVLTSWTIPFLFFLTIASTRFNLIFRVSGFVYLLFEVILCVMLIFCLASILLVVYKNSGKRRLAKQSQFNQRIIKKKTHHRSAVTRVALVTSMFLLCETAISMFSLSIA